MRYIFERTSQVYCLANQLAALEITNLENAGNTRPAGAAGFTSRGLAAPPDFSTSPAENLRSLVNQWQQLQTSFQAVLHPNDPDARESLHLVALSDPSGVLTFRVPRIGNVDVVNLYVRVAPHWFWLFAMPCAAHDDYAENKQVFRVLFGNTQHIAGDE